VVDGPFAPSGSPPATAAPEASSAPAPAVESGVHITPAASEGPAAAGIAPPGAPAAPSAEVSYTTFNLPEGVTLGGAGLDHFTAFARERGLSQEHAQSLIDMHTSERQGWEQQQRDAWSETRQGWRNEIMASEDLGGAGFKTNQATANRMLQMFVPEGQREAFDQFLTHTGATDNPQFFRFLLNVARRFDEPQGAVPAPTPRAPAAPASSGGTRLSYAYSRRGGG